jgi:DMSO/TMAO reductase YedYZ molybdopterin-dependent catalytic subunit
MAHRLYGSRWHGIALGLISTFAGLAAAELITGFFRGASSPVLPVGQEVIDIVPPEVKDWAIDWFGTADKAVLILGTVLSLAVIGSIVGNLAVKGQRAAAYSVTAVVGLIGVYAVAMRPAPSFTKMLPPIVGTIVSIAVIWWLAPRNHQAAPVQAGPTARSSAADPDGIEPAPVMASVGGISDVPRRRFLQGATAVGSLSVLVGGIGRVLRGRFDVDGERATLDLPDPVDTIPQVQNTVPPTTLAETSSTIAEEVAEQAIEQFSGNDFGLEGLTPYIVPNSNFYRIDTALSVPQVPRDSWKLRIHGMVDNELELTFADVLDRPMIERDITLSCVSNRIGGDLVGNATWQGIRMKELLEEAGVQPGATQVVSRSIDGWNCGSPTSIIMDGRDAMLAIAMNGEPLPAEHGYPVRLVVPGLYGYVSATKWVTEIELTRWEDFDGYWIPRGWSKEGPVKTMARIDRPGNGRKLDIDDDGAVTVAGLAWAVHRGVSKVEVRIDDGDWHECELAGVPSDDTWRQWRYRWADHAPGTYQLTARAYDGDGVPQPIGPKNVDPDGAEGYHSTRFHIDDV